MVGCVRIPLELYPYELHLLFLDSRFVYPYFYPSGLQRWPAEGRGVYALTSFEVDEIVEICPVKNFAQQLHLEPEHVKFYTFNWPELTGRHFGRALAGGLGGLHNGANPAKMKYEAHWDRPHPVLRFIAHRMISEGATFGANQGGTQEIRDAECFVDRDGAFPKRVEHGLQLQSAKP
jgi:hypothetical protein